MTEAFPLQWPDGWPRTPAIEVQWSLAGGRRHTQSWNTVLRRLRDELWRLDANNIVISTNQPIRKDGEPYAATRLIDDPGAAVYFELNGRAMVMAQDRYELLLDNLRSLALAIEGLRQTERHGGAHMMERAFAGFEALPPPMTGGRPWYDVLGVAPDAPRAEIEAAWRAKARECHPDAGGDHETMAAVNAAYEQAKEARAA